jgi:hypothetical protein
MTLEAGMKGRIVPSIVAALALTAWPALGNIPGKIVADNAPPPPPSSEESAPHGRVGFIWAPGYYSYADSKYVWNKGHWVVEREGYRYVAPRWAQEEGRWILYPESWVRNEDDKTKTALKGSVPTIR